MGNKTVTTQNLLVLRIDTALNLLFLKGCIPGCDNNHIFIRDAKRKVMSAAKRKLKKGMSIEDGSCLPAGVDALPFPAGTVEMAEGLQSVITAETRGRNPYVPLTL